MRSNTKLKPPPSTTFEQLRTSLDLIVPKGARAGRIHDLLAEMKSVLRLLEDPQMATEAQSETQYHALEKAEQNLLFWRRKPRPSRAKATFKLARVIDEVLLVPRFAAAPMSAATVSEIESRMPRPAGRAAILKAIQRRRARQVAP